ncbi:POTRA domain-containing protein, partial [Bordetella sp. LUAb4]|uniref:ShlB/FhaC/HecB family hemolysin secretion/activation protein n=1 Tax=Bordetella sp. LUAb4 TaxID=2843195 RepID=UPI0027150BAF
EMQRLQEQEMEQQRLRSKPSVDVFTNTGTGADEGAILLPDESPCYLIRAIDWTGDEAPDWLRERAQAVIGRCVGNQGMLVLQRELKPKPVDHGLITSRVLFPEQSLTDGVLRLHYVLGTIGHVAGDASVGWWRTVLPAGPGDPLNQRDLDQALENMRRLVGQPDAEIELEPGAAVGQTNLRIRPGTGKRWHGYLGGDNAGLDSTGRDQINAGLTLDSPLFLYDQLSFAWNSNAG